VVRFATSLGGIDVILTPSVTPLTVANFLTYVCSGAYTSGFFPAAAGGTPVPYSGGTLIHRSLPVSAGVPPYVIQGGGFALGPANIPALIPQNAPVNNEFKTSNTRGTIAMAQYNGNINSATNEWYFNTQDNSSTLDSQDFTVFGNVANNPSLAVMDAINALPIWVENFGGDSNFSNLPLLSNYSCPVAGSCPLIKADNFVLVTSVTPIAPATTAASFQDAATFASLSATGISPGEIITLYGTDLGPAQVANLELDATGTLVTNLLEGTQVLFNNIPGPMIFTYTGQVAVVVPYEIAGQSTVNVVVSYLGLQTSSVTFNVVPATPGVFTLNNSGRGDAVIVRNSDASVVSASSPASPGDVLVLFGEGYGVTSPSLADGALVGSNLPDPVAQTVLLIDGQTVTPIYAGGTPTEINGLLQVDFTVPQLTPGSHQIQIKVGNAISPTGVTLATH
jgi:uncharacterized protein (TIGR03437 family)